MTTYQQFLDWLTSHRKAVLQEQSFDRSIISFTVTADEIMAFALAVAHDSSLRDQLMGIEF